MATQVPRLRRDTTKFFTVTYSSAPDTDAYFAVFADSGSGVLVHSETAVSSNSGITYGVHYTIPSNSAYLLYDWRFVSSYGVGPVVLGGRFRAIKHTAC